MPEHSLIALVTGGSRGLGRSTVLALAARGVDCIFTYQANREAADEVVALAEQAGAKAVALRLDTGDTSGFSGFVEEVRRVLGGWGAERFDYLVNNAGDLAPRRLRGGDGGRLRRAVPGPRQGGLLPDPSAPAADQRRRPDREPVLRPHADHLSRQRGLWFHEGRGGGHDPLHGQGTRSAPHRGQRRGARRHPDRLQRREGARQSGGEPSGRLRHRARPCRASRTTSAR